MTNMAVTDETVEKIERFKEITDHIRSLTAEKGKLQSEILAAMGVDESASPGTLTFTGGDGSIVAKANVSEELKVDHAALVGQIALFKRKKLLGTVVKVEVKVDKRTFDSMDEKDRFELFGGAVTRTKKKPTLEV